MLYLAIFMTGGALDIEVNSLVKKRQLIIEHYRIVHLL